MADCVEVFTFGVCGLLFLVDKFKPPVVPKYGICGAAVAADINALTACEVALFACWREISVSSLS